MTGVVEIECGIDAPARARAVIGGSLDRLDADVLTDVKLLVSELMTNSVRYGGEGTVSLSVRCDGPRSVRVEVVDEGLGFTPSPRAMDALDAGGWGLHIVDALADRWGVRADRAHVWFEIDRSGRAPDPRT